MTVYKPLAADDKVSTKTLLHEAIPITGTIVSGTYSDLNVQNFAHGMFQSVYDYPYLSSSANHIFDITLGTSADGYAVSTQTAKKDNMYNQMAQVLMGYDKDGNIKRTYGVFYMDLGYIYGYPEERGGKPNDWTPPEERAVKTQDNDLENFFG